MAREALCVALLLVLGSLAGSPAWAAGAAIDPGTSAQVPCGHGTCTEVKTTLHGTAPGGPYSVPVTLLYPPSRRCRGVGIVDMVNTIGNRNDPSYAPLPFFRLFLGDAFLGDQGYVYVAVQWDAEVASPARSSAANGVIHASADGYEIIGDAAGVLRANRVCPARAVIATGYSQTGGVARELVIGGHNRRDGGLLFEGLLAGGNGGGCWPLDAPRYLCPTMVDGQGKLISLVTESDVNISYADLARGPSADYRQYEIAGTSHLQKGLNPVPTPSQDPVSIDPVARAAVYNLDAWVAKGTVPPDSAYIDCAPFDPVPWDQSYHICMTSFFFGLGTLGPDGNATGGVRLPNMISQLGGATVGAPLGQYAGLDMPSFIDLTTCLGFPTGGVCTDPTQLNFNAIGGSFTPYDAGTLAARYPSHDDYVEAVVAAARVAYQNRWILWDDLVDYTVTAAHCPVGRTTSLGPTDFDACHGL
jgi:hypothetical protein